MAFHFTNTDNVTDDATLQLSIADAVATASVAGTNYLFASGFFDDGVSVFAVAADGSLTNVDNVTDDATLELDGVAGLTTAVVGGVTYLFTTSFLDDGVSVFAVAADGTLTNVDNISDDATLEIDGAFGATTAVVGGTTYLFVTGEDDDGVSVFAVAADGTLTNVDNVTDDSRLEIDGAFDATTAVVGGTTYLFVTGLDDDGVSVFSVAADGSLADVDNVTDGGARQLDQAREAATAVVDGTTYLFVAGFRDSGVSVFSVAADGTLTNVDNVTDDATLEIGGAFAVTTAVIGGTTHLFVTGGAFAEDGMSVFAVAADGTLTNVANIVDDATLQLALAHSVTTAVVGGVTHLFVAAQGDSGVSAFSLDGNVPLLGDVLWRHGDGTPATAGHEFPAVPATFQIAATGDFDGDGDADILWRHVDGLVVTWEMEDGNLLATHDFGAVPTGWQIEGTGDFDGDGDSDILWRGSQGEVVTWEMEDGLLVTNHNHPAVSSSFQIAGTGDFDADGDDDILWRGSQGQVVTWEMEDGELLATHSLPDVSTSFEVAGTGDFDADGDADILWRHVDGTTVTWEMQGGDLLATHNFGVVSTSFQVEGTEDFDSDGDADILWRHTDGIVVTWEMEDGALQATEDFGVVPTGWQVAGTGEFDLV
jgi:6-phosphogluconolactonase (cycloisomerase 2 family)/quercetin dioxygenase-like cupin family protein